MTSTKMTIAQKKQWIITVLEKPRNVELAIVAIYNRQTADEQATRSTNQNNSRGFNGLDAEFGTSLAQAVIKYGSLSPRQAPHARKIVGKYWQQLIEVATAKGNAPWCERK
jgi:hypothetical protein